MPFNPMSLRAQSNLHPSLSRSRHLLLCWPDFYRSHCARRLLLMLASSLLLCAAATDIASQERNVVVVRPKEIQDVLVNPGMGITTFQRFNGQEPNPPLKWSELGPEKKLPPAASKPDFPDTSVSYCRWYWNVLEPEPG